jgi:hypothetical protein
LFRGSEMKRYLVKILLTVGVIILLTGVSISSAIIVSEKFNSEGNIVDSFDPKPDLYCQGYIRRTGVTPGRTFVSRFHIWNEGEDGSLLNWEIVSWPEWGNWSFNYLNGSNLEALDVVDIDVTLKVPDVGSAKFTGNIRVINTDDPTDYDDVGVYITTIRDRNFATNYRENCACKEISVNEKIYIGMQLDRLKVYSSLILVLSKYNQELKEISEKLSNRISILTNICNNMDNPILTLIICNILEFIAGSILQLGLFIGVIGQFFNYSNMQILANIFHNIFLISKDVWWGIIEFEEEIGC